MKTTIGQYEIRIQKMESPLMSIEQHPIDCKNIYFTSSNCDLTTKIGIEVY